jgi:hypothetical protein
MGKPVHIVARYEKEGERGTEVPIFSLRVHFRDLTSPTRPHLLKVHHLSLAPEPGDHTFNTWTLVGGEGSQRLLSLFLLYFVFLLMN